MTTMLRLVQQASGEMGLVVPTAVASSTSSDIIQLLALLNAVGNEISREKTDGWQRMVREYRFSTVFFQYTGTSTAGSTSLTAMSSIVSLDSTFGVSGVGLTQDTNVVSAVGTTVTIDLAATAAGTGTTFTFGQLRYAFPSDFDRLVDRTDWDKSRHWEMLGPETGQQWQFLKSGYISTGPRVRFRPLGGYFQIWPLPTAVVTLGFEYVSLNWVLAVTDTIAASKALFTADTDSCIFPDRLMVLGLKKKYFEVKGFDTTALYRDYSMHLDIAKANDVGAPTLSMAPRPGNVLIGPENIPDSGYGLP